MSIRTKILDQLLKWLLESKISPIGWLNVYKTILGNVLTAISGLLIVVEQSFCPGPEWCAYIAQGQALIAFLLSLIVKLVGEWHHLKKEAR